MANVRLDRLLREEEALADLTIDESVGDELQDFDFARGRFLLELAEKGRRREGEHGAGGLRVPTCGSRLEATAVIAIPIQDLSPLCGVHAMRIGGAGMAL